jgi:hypothetical protein
MKLQAATPANPGLSNLAITDTAYFTSQLLDLHGEVKLIPATAILELAVKRRHRPLQAILHSMSIDQLMSNRELESYY